MTKAKLYIEEIANVRGLNRSQLQIKAGVTLSMLNRYWSNDTDSVHLESLGKLAQALEVPVSALFSGNIPQNKENVNV
ncbi:MAG: helix-turn-helix domain-containing protein [Ktedonobacteraceae bacterium]